MSNEDQLYQRYGRDCPAGTVVFREGEPGSEMYVIQSGRVRIARRFREMEKLLADLGPGEFFGEMAIISAKPRTGTAVALEDTRLLAIDGKTFENMVRTNAEIAIRLIRKFAERLAEADAQIENLLLQDASSRVVHYLARQAETAGKPGPGGVTIEVKPEALPAILGVSSWQVEDVLGKMNRAKICVAGPQGMLVPEVARLHEFLDFLAKREKFRDLA